MALNGSSVVFAIDTSATATPAYTVIPCQTDGSYSPSQETIDESCKDSRHARRGAGRADHGADFSVIASVWPALKASPSTPMEHLRAAIENGTKKKFAVVVAGTNVETFEAFVTGHEIALPDQDKVQVDITLEFDGAPVPVP